MTEKYSKKDRERIPFYGSCWEFIIKQNGFSLAININCREQRSGDLLYRYNKFRKEKDANKV